MEDCLFCSIVSGAIPSSKVYEDDVCLAFRDINPLAQTHVLVIPKEHIASCAELSEEHEALIGHIFTVIAKLAKELGLKDGFRVVSNSGVDAGQTVGHLHFHLLAGKPMNAKMV